MMNSNSLVTAVCNTVSGIAGVTVTPEFPDKLQDLPLRNPVISVGVNNISVDGVDDAKLTASASPSTVTVRVSVCVPKPMTGERCMQTVDSVINALKSLLTSYSIVTVKAGNTRYSSTLSALVTDVDIKFYSGNAF